MARSADGHQPPRWSGADPLGRQRSTMVAARGPLMTQKSGATGIWPRSSGQGRSLSNPPMRPPRLHGGVRLAATDKQRAAAMIQIGFGERIKPDGTVSRQRGHFSAGSS